MADITIPDLDATTDVDDSDLFVLDNTAETFKVTAANLALYLRESILPAGITQAFAGSVVPPGWLICDGAAVSRTTYARLFASISTTYGVGDGTTTFNVPDIRGRVILGKDNMGGVAAARITNAVAGFDATVLGAAGGVQTYTPAGTNGGSQSIAHTHNVAHTHTFAHHHQWGHMPVTTRDFFALTTGSNSVIVVDSGDTKFLDFDLVETDAGSGARVYSDAGGASNLNLYTTGVLSPASGSGATATTAAASITNSGAMSAGATVNGSNFTFTGTAANKVQPSITMNMIIKT